MRLDPLPPEAVARLDPLRRSIYTASEVALRDIAGEPGAAGDALRRLRPDLARPPPPPPTAEEPRA